MAKLNIKDTANKAVTYTKTYWSKPPIGQYISLSEKISYGGAQIGVFIFQAITGYMGFVASWFCGSIMKIDFMDFYIISIITMIMTYVMIFMNPIAVLIYENHGKLEKKTKILAHTIWSLQIIIGIALYFIPTDIFESVPVVGIQGLPQIVANILIVNSITNYVTWFIRWKFCGKYGRLKPLIIILAVPAAIMMSIIPFLPLNNIDYAWKLIILHFAFTLMTFFINHFNNIQGMVTFMSPNSQERQSMYSIIPIVTSLAPSVIGIFFPILISTTGGFTELLTYQIFVPIFAISGAIITILCTLKCKERIIETVNDENKPKVKFFKGAKRVLQNKYLWIIEFSKIVGISANIFSAVLQFWFVYSLRMEWFFGIAANLVVLSMTFGNLLTPWLTKKYEKRTILIGSRGMSLVCIVAMFGAILIPNNIVGVIVFMLASFAKNFFVPIETGINNSLQADAMDYHQWKHGERADGMVQVFSWLFGPLVILIGFILPFLFERCGFTSDWDVLFNKEIIKDVFNIHIWVSFISLFLATVPFIFYNLSKDKHSLCIKEMEERVAAYNLEHGIDDNAPAKGEENILLNADDNTYIDNMFTTCDDIIIGGVDFDMTDNIKITDTTQDPNKIFENIDTNNIDDMVSIDNSNITTSQDNEKPINDTDEKEVL